MRAKNVKLRLRSVQVLVFVLLKICLIFSGNLYAQKRIVIDPGHGGKDAGAIAPEKRCEKDLVLAVAEEMVKLNRTLFDNELELYLTRYKDTLISLKDRANLARELNADVFISLHCNHAQHTNAKGVEVYVAKNQGKFLTESVFLAYQLQKQFQKKLGFKSRGVKFANFQVLRETADSMPSVLIELGFLSNKDERDYYQKPENIRALALVLLNGLVGNIEDY